MKNYVRQAQYEPPVIDQIAIRAEGILCQSELLLNNSIDSYTEDTFDWTK
ncbi:MAG: hypothetical protein IJ314_00460 [Bacteroidales bacterium]|nr:hypothetical protein [Bacteroidales bacterium]